MGRFKRHGDAGFLGSGACGVNKEAVSNLFLNEGKTREEAEWETVNFIEFTRL